MKFSEALALVLTEEEKSDFTAFRNFHFYEGQKGHPDIEGCLCIQKKKLF